MACERVKEFLSRNGHEFVDRNVDEDPSAYEDLIARGFRTIPVTVIGDTIVKGFDAARLEAALRAAS
jgi:glutaredoxin 3